MSVHQIELFSSGGLDLIIPLRVLSRTFSVQLVPKSPHVQHIGFYGRDGVKSLVLGTSRLRLV